MFCLFTFCWNILFYEFVFVSTRDCSIYIIAQYLLFIALTKATIVSKIGAAVNLTPDCLDCDVSPREFVLSSKLYQRSIDGAPYFGKVWNPLLATTI